MTAEQRVDRLLSDLATPAWKDKCLREVLVDLVEAAVLAEREACAKLAESRAKLFDPDGVFPRVYKDFAILIRSRGLLLNSDHEDVLAEREACAKIADGTDGPEEDRGFVDQCCLNTAKAIRSRDA